MLGPNQVLNVEISKPIIDKLVEDIDHKLKTTSLKYNNKIDVILHGELNKQIRDKIVELYTQPEVGWKKVVHRTSSENGERPGLTLFEFYFEE